MNDADGSALPGVTVTLENSETGLTRVGVTGETGAAVLPALPPGTYKATFELEGFSPVSQDEVVLRVGQTVAAVPGEPELRPLPRDAAGPGDPARPAVGVLDV